MALLDITNSNTPPILYFARGNIGTLVDEVAKNLNSIKIPEVTGGGDEVSFVVSAA